MNFNPKGAFETLLKACNPHKSAGKVLLAINAMGMVFAALSNTFAAAVDKDTSAQDKKFLVPAGLVTGVANIGIYYAMTTKIIKGLEKAIVKIVGGEIQNKNGVEKFVGSMTEADKIANATKFVNNKIQKTDKSLWLKLTKGTDYVKNLTGDMKKTWFKETGEITTDALKEYQGSMKNAGGVFGAFSGAIIGCAILTPIIRDISAYFVQKYMEKKNPNLKEQPYKPYFEPTRIQSTRYGNQPFNMKSYMAMTSGKMKV